MDMPIVSAKYLQKQMNSTEFEKFVSKVSKGKNIISFDFDDTLFSPILYVKDKTTFANETEKRIFDEYRKMFLKRMEFFKSMVNNKEFSSFVVTARSARIDEIEEFCREFDIKMDAVIFDAGDKEILSEMKVVVHFDDDPTVLIKLSRMGIPTMTFGEWIDRDFVAGIWIRHIEENDTLKYYLAHRNCSKDDLMEYKTFQPSKMFESSTVGFGGEDSGECETSKKSVNKVLGMHGNDFSRKIQEKAVCKKAKRGQSVFPGIVVPSLEIE